jgi:hypothetical protein
MRTARIRVHIPRGILLAKNRRMGDVGRGLGAKTAGKMGRNMMGEKETTCDLTVLPHIARAVGNVGDLHVLLLD